LARIVSLLRTKEDSFSRRSLNSSRSGRRRKERTFAVTVIEGSLNLKKSVSLQTMGSQPSSRKKKRGMLKIKLENPSTQMKMLESLLQKSSELSTLLSSSKTRRSLASLFLASEISLC